jgi:hypothetical protein
MSLARSLLDCRKAYIRDAILREEQMIRHLSVTGLAALGAAAMLCSVGTAHADLIISPTTGLTTDTWQAETGQSIPTGTAGYVDGSLVAETAGPYRFTFGPPPPIGVAGGTGYGNSLNINEFWVGPRAAAVAAGDFFCTKKTTAGDCAGGITPVGKSFIVNMTAGEDIPFVFQFAQNGDGSGGNRLANDGTSTGGAYLAQLIGAGCTSLAVACASPSAPMAFLALSDLPYPGDHDFQDLTLLVTEVPEPASTTLLATALIGIALGIRRKKRQARLRI